MDKGLLLTYTPELSCAQCINSGYVFIYNSVNADATSADTGFCCRKNTDTTLFCGNDELMYKHYEALSTLSLTDTNKMRDLLQKVLDASYTDVTNKASLYNAVMTDLYTTYSADKAQASGWETTSLAAWEAALEKATIYANSVTTTEITTFENQFTKLKALWSTDGGDKTVAGSAAKSFLDYQATAVASQTRALWEAEMRIMALQHWLGQTNYELLAAGQNVLAGISSPTSDDTASIAALNGYVDPSLTTVTTDSIAAAILTDLSDDLYMALQGARIISNQSTTTATSTNFKSAYDEYETNLKGLSIITQLAQRTYALAQSKILWKEFADAAATSGAMTKFMNEAKYMKASSAIYHDFRVAKTKLVSLQAGTNSIYTAIQSAFDAQVALSDTTVELTGISNLCYLQDIDYALNTSLAADAKLKTLVDEYALCTQKLYDGSSTTPSKARIDTCNKALIFLTVQDFSVTGVSAYDATSLANSLDNAFKVMKMARVLSTTAGSGTAMSANVFDFSLMLVGMSYFYQSSGTATVASSNYSKAYQTVTAFDIAAANGLNDAAGSQNAYEAWLQQATKSGGGAYTQNERSTAIVWNALPDQTPPTGGAAEQLYTNMLNVNNAATSFSAAASTNTEAQTFEAIEGLQNALKAIALNYRNDLAQAVFTQTALEAYCGLLVDFTDNTSLMTTMEWAGCGGQLTSALSVFEVAQGLLIGYIEDSSKTLASAEMIALVAIIENGIDTTSVTVQSSPVVQAGAVQTEGASVKSSDFTSQLVALNACQNHQTQCGTKKTTITSGSSTTLTAALTSATQSCSWLLKASCGAPKMEISGIGNLHMVTYYEYQKGLTGVTMDTTDVDALDKTVDTIFYDAALYEGNTLGLLKMAKTGEADTYCPGNLVMDQIKQFKAEKKWYDGIKADYETDVAAYNKAVGKVETELEDEERVIGEERGPRGQRETSLTKLPEKPFKPVKPAAYDGVDILDTTTVTTTMVSGWGYPTGGSLNGNTFKYGKHKTFGFIAQGAEVSSPALTVYDASASACEDRYLAINVNPLATPSSTSTTVIKVTKQSGEKPTAEGAEIFDLTITADEKKLSSPTAAKTSPYLQLDGAMNLMAATTASLALVASTLF